jgi:hypothetical protein
MKVRWVTLLMIAAILTSVSAFGQSAVALKDESVVWVAPIVPTVDGYDTGITVVNVVTTPLTVTNFVFYSLSGSQAVGAESVQAELVNRKLAGQSYTVPGNGRFSMLATQILGAGLNGQLRFSVIGLGAKKALAYEGILSPDFNTDIVAAEEITSRERSPQN